MADRIVLVGPDRTYTTPALAIAGESDFQAGEDNIIFEIDAGVYSSALSISGFTTSADHRLIFRCASGDHHGFVRGAGVRIVGVANWSTMVVIDIAYVELDGLSISNTGAGTTYSVYVGKPSNNFILKSCFIYGSSRGIQTISSSSNFLAINSAVVSCAYGMYLRSEPGYVYNCVVLNCTTNGIIDATWQALYLKNCYAGGNGVDYNKANGSAYITTCFSSDGTHNTGVISIANCSFTNSTAGSEDVSIGSDSDLIDVGTDLSGDSTYPFDTDGYGNSRGEDWDVGVMEYVPASGGPLVGASALVGGGVLCGQGNLIN
jgi:hypothetical protein